MNSKYSLLQVVPLLLVVAAASGQVSFKKGAPHVTLANSAVISGSIKASRDGRPYTSFVGIPYATVPERFAASQPIATPAWQGVKSAITPGPMCPQNYGLGPEGKFEGEEDCLYLNVHVPMNNTGKRGYPVLFWVHGGGFIFGSGSAYGPEFFMDEDVILVTINYRLGVFGFLSTGDEVVPGNNGLKDQVQALKWVQENIRQFGGNPDQVTIFGESAGGASVHYLMLSETTTGLFHRAISQSGTALAPWAVVPDPKAYAVKLATHLKCPTTAADPLAITSEEILTCLKALSVEELNKGQFEFASTWPLNLIPLFFHPVIEPAPSATSKNVPFMVESAHSIVLDKNKPLKQVPWMVGATEDEGCTLYAGMVLSQETLLADINTNWDTVAPNAMVLDRYFPVDEQKVVTDKIKQFYFGAETVSSQTAEALTNLYSDNFFAHDIYRSAIETAARGKKNRVYFYQYSYHGPTQIVGGPHMPERESKLVGHADELQHLFTLKGVLPGIEGDFIKPDTPHEEFSKNLVRLWASFAIHGEPKHTWGINVNKKWKSISRKDLDGTFPLRVFKIDSNPTFIEHTRTERMKFWDQLWLDHYTPILTGTKAAQAPTKTEL